MASNFWVWKSLWKHSLFDVKNATDQAGNWLQLLSSVLISVIKWRINTDFILNEMWTPPPKKCSLLLWSHWSRDRPESSSDGDGDPGCIEYTKNQLPPPSTHTHSATRPPVTLTRSSSVNDERWPVTQTQLRDKSWEDIYSDLSCLVTQDNVSQWCQRWWQCLNSFRAQPLFFSPRKNIPYQHQRLYRAKPLIPKIGLC